MHTTGEQSLIDKEQKVTDSLQAGDMPHALSTVSL